MSSPMNKYILFFAKQSPLSFVQLSAGISLFSLSTLSIIPFSALLFHPRIVRWHSLHRIPLAFFVLGNSLPSAANSVLSIYYHASLEQSLRPTKTIQLPKPAKKETALRKWFRKINKTFLNFHLISAAAITAIEFLFAYNDNIIVEDKYIRVFPYALFPILHSSTKWLWALSSQSHVVSTSFGSVSIDPLLFTCISSCVGGFDSVLHAVKGLAAALIAMYSLKIPAWNGDDPMNFLIVKSTFYANFVQSFISNKSIDFDD